MPSSTRRSSCGGDGGGRSVVRRSGLDRRVRRFIAPTDLEVTRDETELHVEVKGTVNTGTAVTLTMNEVRHAAGVPSSAFLDGAQ